jgi:hypothetical protein
MINLTREKTFLVMAYGSESEANTFTKFVAVVLGEEMIVREYVSVTLAKEFKSEPIFTIQEIINPNFSKGNLQTIDLRREPDEGDLPGSDSPQAVS